MSAYEPDRRSQPINATVIAKSITGPPTQGHKPGFFDCRLFSVKLLLYSLLPIKIYQYRALGPPYETHLDTGLVLCDSSSLPMDEVHLDLPDPKARR